MTNTDQSNQIIYSNNMCEQITFLNLGPIPELEAVNQGSIDTDVEEIIAVVTVTSLSEAQDDLLFALKHTPDPVASYSYEDESTDNHKIPCKRLKTFHEHPIPEPMDICINKSSQKWMYSCCAECVKTDGQIPSQYCRRAYPDCFVEKYSDDSDEEREIDEYDPHRVFRAPISLKEEEDCGHGITNDICYDCIWALEEESRRRYPRRRRPQGLEEIAVPSMPTLQRQNTQFSVNGVTVYNGNPNGSRFFDEVLL
jgi:hypothetical protein